MSKTAKIKKILAIFNYQDGDFVPFWIFKSFNLNNCKTPGASMHHLAIYQNGQIVPELL